MTGDTDLKELVTENTYESDREQMEFWKHLFQEMKQWENLKLKDNEKKVLDAMVLCVLGIPPIPILEKAHLLNLIEFIANFNPPASR